MQDFYKPKLKDQAHQIKEMDRNLFEANVKNRYVKQRPAVLDDNLVRRQEVYIRELEEDLIHAEKEIARKVSPNKTYQREVGQWRGQLKDLETRLDEADRAERALNAEIIDKQDLNRRLNHQLEDLQDELERGLVNKTTNTSLLRKIQEQEDEYYKLKKDNKNIP
jgi:chromosome segregation ATPase